MLVVDERWKQVIGFEIKLEYCDSQLNVLHFVAKTGSNNALRNSHEILPRGLASAYFNRFNTIAKEASGNLGQVSFVI